MSACPSFSPSIFVIVTQAEFSYSVSVAFAIKAPREKKKNKDRQCTGRSHCKGDLHFATIMDNLTGGFYEYHDSQKSRCIYKGVSAAQASR